MMALVCLCMLTSVVTWNVETQLLELILMITKVVQTNVEDKKDDIIILIKVEAVNQSQTLDHLSPPNVDKKNLGMLQKVFKKKTFNNNSQLVSKRQPMMKKG